MLAALVSLWSLQACASVQSGGVQYPFPRAAVDIAISLAVGTVGTDEFPVIDEAYFIMLQAEKRLPFEDLVCMMGFDPTNRNFREPVLAADWTVRDAANGSVVTRGSVAGHGAAKFTSDTVTRFLGQFMGAAGKKYGLEVNFTKDGSALNAANPHLIVVLVRYH